ncbi:Pyruvate decarboxylase [Pleurostoma richardsiae]|uniref:Pyruvate decarboxylase n=1 Tax=Pleurostoma richardsiae TaxID=41990 RepID=A0AA38RRX7_9PEZI|nr:Pyruvate decarboxylase [Pleurostoma richardsiae]
MTVTNPPSTSVKVAEYLFTRLRQLGIRSVFGVPGDYNLSLLDYVEPSGLHWVGNCNELNAAYAADGYARIHGVSALITTFGVGELSAINGIAGAYAERVAVVHIVGTPSRALQESRALMHHTLADGDYRRFAAMHSHVSVAQANLTDVRTAAKHIDWVLEQALVHSRPVYLEIPDDVVDVPVLARGLETPISPLPLPLTPQQEASIADRVLERMYAARRPLILVDGESRADGILDQVAGLVRTTGWDTWTTTFGKGLVDEDLLNVHGMYAGRYGDEKTKAYFDSADLAIHLGPHHSDTNSHNFTTLPSSVVTVAFTGSSVRIGNETYRDVPTRLFLARLLERIDASRLAKGQGPQKVVADVGPLPKESQITQKHFYRVANSIFRAGDVVMTETGTAAHGGRSFVLPPGTRQFSAVTWLSIGYMLPASLGVGLARQDAHQSKRARQGRVILFVGDGSLQMSVQEISTIIKEQLDAVIFVINNDGYTIERAIHGRKQGYNDIAPWRHPEMLSFFGASKEHARDNNFQARTWGELEEVLAKPQIRTGRGVRAVEVFMDREDCQGSLLGLLQKQLKEEATV